MTLRLVLFLTLIGYLAVVRADKQIPFLHTSTASSNQGSPFDTFVKHFSASRSGTDVFLQTEISNIYSNSSVVVTQDYNFDLLRFATQSSESILIHELPDVKLVKRDVYLKPSRRINGPGVVAEKVVFGGWEVAWGNNEFKVIAATWIEGFSQVTQWHIISDHPEAAHRLVRDCAEFCSKYTGVVWVFEQGIWRPNRELWESVQEASWDDVVLDDEMKNALQRDYRSFFKSESTYKKFAVPWKRGLIFLGPPGNGKTVSLKAIMKEVELPALYVKSFHNWAGDEAGIKAIFARARAEAPCVLILEDLDSLITDDNRSFFLNEVDGLENNDGLLIIGTTNHFERLDPALSSRPSRFDRKYTFPDPSIAQRRDYAVYWQEKLKTIKESEFPDSLLDEFAEKTGNFSFAYMKEAFVSSLLIVATGEVEKPLIKDSFRTILLNQIKHLREELLSTTITVEVASSSGAGSGGGFNPAYFREFDAPSFYGEEGAIFRYPWVNMM